MVHVIWVVILFFSLWGAFLAGLIWEHMHHSRKWDKKMDKLKEDSIDREDKLNSLLFDLNKLGKDHCNNTLVKDKIAEDDLYEEFGGEG